jgi:uncharacterized protein YjiS (DUF1127 family)
MTTIETHAAGRTRDRTGVLLSEMVQIALDDFTAIVVTAMDWHCRARERRELRGLPDDALKDFGASRADAEHEGTKPFWQR